MCRHCVPPFEYVTETPSAPYQLLAKFRILSLLATDSLIVIKRNRRAVNCSCFFFLAACRTPSNPRDMRFPLCVGRMCDGTCICSVATAQVRSFHDANACGARYHLSLAATSPQIDTAQLLSVAALPCLPKEVHAGDLIVVPCHDVRRISPPAGLIRVSVGLEASCDLLADRPSARRRISSRGSAKVGWLGLRIPNSCHRVSDCRYLRTSRRATCFGTAQPE